MIEVAFSSSFKRVFKKRVKGSGALEEKFWQKVDVFLKEPFHTALRTHKLSGKLKDLWSFQVEYDLRVIFYFADDRHAVFVDIGKHDEVY